MADSGQLISLVYLSQGAFTFRKQDLVELLERARNNNHSLGVSGMLLFKDDNFLQVLEGERQTVLALYKKITKDHRHRKLTALSQQVITQRDFPDWSMGFHNLQDSNASRPEGFTPFLETSLTVENFSGDPGRAKKLLLLFKGEKLLAKRKAAP